ncbi:MAG: hypothetical protein AAB263_21335, partial [Planctomycetota bacterium]
MKTSFLLRVVFILICAAAVRAGEAAPLIELREIPLTTVLFSDGRRIEGDLLMQRSDGTLQFKQKGAASESTISAGTYSSIEHRRTAHEVVTLAAAQAITANDERRIIEVLRWGSEHAAKTAVMQQAATALKKRPASRDILAIVIPLWREKPDWKAMEDASRAALAADSHWDQGNEFVIEALNGQGRTSDVLAYAQEWLSRNPSAMQANLICGNAFESSGEIRSARECYRKAWQIGRSPKGALGFANTSLQTGQYADSLSAATTLIKDGNFVADAKAFGGAAAAALGDLAMAKELLTGFAPDVVSGTAAQAGNYALGLIAFQENRTAAAVKSWATVQTPAAQLALAIAQRREFKTVDRLPADLQADAPGQCAPEGVAGKQDRSG